MIDGDCLHIQRLCDLGVAMHTQPGPIERITTDSDTPIPRCQGCWRPTDLHRIKTGLAIHQKNGRVSGLLCILIPIVPTGFLRLITNP